MTIFHARFRFCFKRSRTKKNLKVSTASHACTQLTIVIAAIAKTALYEREDKKIDVRWWKFPESVAQADLCFPKNLPLSLHLQELRDVALQTPDALEGLLLNVTQPATPSLLKNCVWALSNLCRGKPQPDIKALAPALPVLLTLLSSNDTEVRM